MKRVLFTIIYPFWFFLAKTWLGVVLMICLVPIIPALLIGLVFQSIMNTTGEEAKDIGGGLAIFSLLLSPFIAMTLMSFGWYLEKHYEKWKYKTEI
jgi:diacylglycerol kinase